MKKLILTLFLGTLFSCQSDRQENDCNCVKTYYNRVAYTIINDNYVQELVVKYIPEGSTEKAYTCLPTDYVQIGYNKYYKIFCYK
jgi:hypothetical protein